jgi:hypothetical protein
MNAGSGPAAALPVEYRRELDKQQKAIVEAQAVLSCVVTSIDDYCERSSRQVPLFGDALRVVLAQLESVVDALYEEELTVAASRPNVFEEDD